MGDEDDRFVNREIETRCCAYLSQKGIAPIFYGRFLNGRIEEFYEGAVTLQHSTMLKVPSNASQIGEWMGSLHRLDPPEKEGVCKTVKGVGECWEKMDGWFDLAVGMQSEDALFDGTGGILDMNVWKSEWEWLKTELQPQSTQQSQSVTRAAKLTVPENASPEALQTFARQFAREVVFTHMDAQSLNILSVPVPVPTTDGDTHSDGHRRKLSFIDFEYAGYNPRAVDLGNTFCECCDMNNLKPKYDTEYPTRDEQDYFLKKYIAAADPALYAWLDSHSESHEQQASAWDGLLEELRLEIGKHALVSHLGWAVWGICQSYTSPIDFEFQTYSELRLEGYKLFQQQFFPLRKHKTTTTQRDIKVNRR